MSIVCSRYANIQIHFISRWREDRKKGARKIAPDIFFRYTPDRSTASPEMRSPCARGRLHERLPMVKWIKGPGGMVCIGWE